MVVGAVVAGALVAVVLGWRPFGGGERAIPFRSQPVDAEAALRQPLSDEQLRLSLGVVDVPSTVAPGEDLELVVELRNPTSSSIALAPCPVLFTSFGESGTAAFEVSRLNCADAPGAVEPGDVLRFRWRIAIPTSADFHDGFVGSVYVALRGAGGGIDASGPPVEVRS